MVDIENCHKFSTKLKSIIISSLSEVYIYMISKTNITLSKPTVKCFRYTRSIGAIIEYLSTFETAICYHDMMIRSQNYYIM